MSALHCSSTSFTKSMSDPSDSSANNASGGYTLGGGPAEPLPTSWNRPNQPARIGRVGATSSSSSRYANFTRSRY